MISNKNQISQNNLSSSKAPLDEKFLDFLDDEIENVQQEIKKSGWTIWALIGGLASLVWLFLDELGKNDFNFNNILILLLVSFYIFMIL